MEQNVVQKHIQFYMDNYKIYTRKLKTDNIENKDKRFIGEKDRRKCRFCGKEKGETAFRKIAHAIPKLVGNKVLISFEECDECNDIFSKLENELANYLSFERSTVGIRGKKGIPTYKNNNGLRIEHDKDKSNRFIIQDIIEKIKRKLICMEDGETIKMMFCTNKNTKMKTLYTYYGEVDLV